MSSALAAFDGSDTATLVLPGLLVVKGFEGDRTFVVVKTLSRTESTLLDRHADILLCPQGALSFLAAASTEDEPPPDR